MINRLVAFLPRIDLDGVIAITLTLAEVDLYCSPGEQDRR